MQMKKMMLLAAATLAGVLVADVSVEDVKCTQRYPWNGLVDIEYTIACDDPNAEIYVNPVGFNGDTGLTVFPTHFTGDGATNTVKAGKHTMVWDAKADLGNLFSSKNFQIKMYAGKKLSRYIVIDISGGTEAENYPIRHSIAGPNLDDDTCRTTEIWMRLIPPGTFMMGSPEDEVGRNVESEDLHKVTLTQPYYMGVFEVTQRQWELVMGDRPSYFNNDEEYATRPVEQISFNRMRGTQDPFSKTVASGSFLGVLRTKTNLNGFDLPTDAQWEYACRAGTQTALYSGHDLADTQGDSHLNELGRYYVNGYNGRSVSRSDSTALTTAKVGSYKPNCYGLYDMLGNVSELCRDGCYDSLGMDPVVDPIKGDRYVAGAYGYGWVRYWVVERGGHWDNSAEGCRAALRWHCGCGTDGSYVTSEEGLGDRLSSDGRMYYRYPHWKTVGLRLSFSGNSQN